MNSFHHFIQNADYSDIGKLIESIYNYGILNGLDVSSAVLPHSMIQEYIDKDQIKMVKLNISHGEVTGADVVRIANGRYTLFRIEVDSTWRLKTEHFKDHYSDIDLFYDHENLVSVTVSDIIFSVNESDVYSIFQKRMFDGAVKTTLCGVNASLYGGDGDIRLFTIDGVTFLLYSYDYSNPWDTYSIGASSRQYLVVVKTLAKFEKQVRNMIDEAVAEINQRAASLGEPVLETKETTQSSVEPIEEKPLEYPITTTSGTLTFIERMCRFFRS